MERTQEAGQAGQDKGRDFSSPGNAHALMGREGHQQGVGTECLWWAQEYPAETTAQFFYLRGGGALKFVLGGTLKYSGLGPAPCNHYHFRQVVTSSVNYGEMHIYQEIMSLVKADVPFSCSFWKFSSSVPTILPC